jgi:hypothetical protein
MYNKKCIGFDAAIDLILLPRVRFTETFVLVNYDSTLSRAFSVLRMSQPAVSTNFKIRIWINKQLLAQNYLVKTFVELAPLLQLR